MWGSGEVGKWGDHFVRVAGGDHCVRVAGGGGEVGKWGSGETTACALRGEVGKLN